eukprot:RCo019253
MHRDVRDLAGSPVSSATNLTAAAPGHLGKRLASGAVEDAGARFKVQRRLPDQPPSAGASANQPNTKQRRDLEEDRHRVEQRLKQIAKGKNTVGYANYIALVPRSCRGPDHPRTPDPY